MVLNQGQCDPPATFRLEMPEDTFECWKRGRSSGAAAWGGRGQGCYSAQDAPTAKKPQLVRVVLNDLGTPGDAKTLLGDTARSEQLSS